MVGPEDLPKVAVWLARMLRRIRSVISELKKESGWNDLLEREINAGDIKAVKKDIDDNMRRFQSDINSTTSEIESEIRIEE